MATRRSVTAAKKWMASASGSLATGRVTWQGGDTISGKSLATGGESLLWRARALHLFDCCILVVFCSALYVVDLKKFRKIAAGDRLRGQYQGLSQDPNSLSNLDQVSNRLRVQYS